MVTLFTSNYKLTFETISEQYIVFATLITAPACLDCSAKNFASLSVLCSTCTFNPCFTKDQMLVGESATHFSALHFFGNSPKQVLIMNTYKIRDTTKYKDFSPASSQHLSFYLIPKAQIVFQHPMDVSRHCLSNSLMKFENSIHILNPVKFYARKSSLKNYNHWLTLAGQLA